MVHRLVALALRLEQLHEQLDEAISEAYGLGVHRRSWEPTVTQIRLMLEEARAAAKREGASDQQLTRKPLQQGGILGIVASAARAVDGPDDTGDVIHAAENVPEAA